MGMPPHLNLQRQATKLHNSQIDKEGQVISLLEAEQFELPFMRTTHPVKAEGHDQNARILAHLQAGRTLTALEALEWFKCFRLASRICDLRKAGNQIEKRTIKTNSGKSVAQYYL
jgi:hypothetical protein